MCFISDRDLLLYEPNILNEVIFTSQNIIENAACDFDGFVLTSDAVDFNEYPIQAGGILKLNDKSYEIVEKISANKLRLSQIRVNASDPYIKGSYSQNGVFSVPTFKHQISLVHESLLSHLNVEQDQILDINNIQEIEANLVLFQIYSAAIAMGEEGHFMNKIKMEHYDKKYKNLIERLAIEIDSDSESVPNHLIHLNSIQLKRT
ncbi:hypothetical protein JD969_09040 [Planctomycetota bacterium]|nr:hypothetical protein JD969_09040 [Planctomycetota bacterium]